jgi:hypothetical protein
MSVTSYSLHTAIFLAEFTALSDPAPGVRRSHRSPKPRLACSGLHPRFETTRGQSSPLVPRAGALRCLGVSGLVAPCTPVVYQTSSYMCSRSRPAAQMAVICSPEQGASFRLAPLVAVQIRYRLDSINSGMSETLVCSVRWRNLRTASRTTDRLTSTAVFVAVGLYGLWN